MLSKSVLFINKNSQKKRDVQAKSKLTGLAKNVSNLSVRDPRTDGRSSIETATPEPHGTQDGSSEHGAHILSKSYTSSC